MSAGTFKTLVTAVQAAGLVETLKSPELFTVAKLPPGTTTTLPQNIPQLTKILTYHVVSGCLLRDDLSKLSTVTSLEGSPIILNLSEGFEVKNATVVIADVIVDNGVIHVIDNVLLMG